MTLTNRQKWIIKFLAQEGAASTNQLYVNTSPACLSQGRKRAMGTYGWKTPANLEKLGLIACQINVRRAQLLNEGKVSSLRRPSNAIRYTWTLTPAGKVIADLLPPVAEAGVFKGKKYVMSIG